MFDVILGEGVFVIAFPISQRLSPVKQCIRNEGWCGCSGRLHVQIRMSPEKDNYAVRTSRDLTLSMGYSTS